MTMEPMRVCRTVIRLALPFAALSLALSACAPSEPTTGPTDQETAMQSPTPSSAPSASGAPSGSASAAPSAPPSSTPDASPVDSLVNAMLTISMWQDASAEPVQYVLECVDGAPGPASTLPDAEAACAALDRLGVEFLTARPNKDIICTQQYGGPQTASITGDVNGTSVRAAFALTDGCEISRWKTAQDILGAPGEQ